MATRLAGPDGWAVARGATLVAMAAAFVALVATGVPLVWFYRPQGGLLEGAHAVSSVVFLGAAVAHGAVVVLRRLTQRGPGAVLGAVLVPLAVAGGVTGTMIAWDQVGLLAVTAGGGWSDWSGVIKASSPTDVRFVLVGHRAIPPTTYGYWVIAHTMVVPAIAIALVIASLWRVAFPHAQR